MKTLFLIPLLLIGITNARPQDGAVNEDFETLTDGVEQLGKNFWKIYKIIKRIFLGNFFKKTIFAGKDISNVVNSKTLYAIFDTLANLYSLSLGQTNLAANTTHIWTIENLFKNDNFSGKDISKVVNSKTGALVFIGGNAFNYTVDAAGTVSSGLGQAGTFINGITLEGLENGTIR